MLALKGRGVNLNCFIEKMKTGTGMDKRYNTGNPRPSNSMKDLNDNALAYDDFLNSESDTFIDRFGNAQDTMIGATKKMAAAFDAQLSGQQSRFETVMKNAGSQVLGRYEDGPWTITDYNQLISYGGTFWKLAASVVIGSGYTTAGNSLASWNATDKKNFVDVGQDQLRSELGTIFMPGPSGNATTDVQLLKSALNVGGFINYNVPGKYLYNDSGVIKSGTS
ncbi:hypothetical protein M2S12_24450, partial [Klebsiella pneumoniae]|nr:hypothetical protein [Klebsiella pneumoniae]